MDIVYSILTYYIRIMYANNESNAHQTIAANTSFHNSSYFLEITITLLNQLFLSLRHQIRQTPFLQPLSWLALQRHQLFQTLRVLASVVLLVQAAIHLMDFKLA